MRSRWKRSSLVLMFTMFFLVQFSLGPAVLAGEEEGKKKDLPERAISISPEYPGVIIDEGDDVSVDLLVKNGGRRDEIIELGLDTIPQGWDARIKTYSFGVTGVFVRSDDSKSLSIKAVQEDDVEPGDYVFTIKARTQDGGLTSTSQLTVKVIKKEEEKKSEGVEILTSYPVLRGPTDAKFEFSIEVKNKLDKDTIFNLAARGPEKWDINFKPAYEDKFISSLRLKSDQSQTVAVEVKPFFLADPGQYPIKVKVSSPEAKGEADLMMVLTGTYKMDAGTADGRLSMSAVRGKGANLSVYVKNSGSASLNNVQFLSIKPENWKVSFNPEKIETLAPEELKQIELTVTPADQALVGDYSVGIKADAGRVSSNIELRVTAKATASWAWIGIGIIVLVMTGLVVLFVRLGRR